ncbi:hypothetical protein BN13_610012 [Nostocoides jenkinsii Ben 74]|uniref:Uncharacterized protein n=1 Tax=Nostocoides jenkinsii Ben 74 TaxID=1193518 RepID=A0A077M9Y5_9MICO|nr:hypothetical protein BN13_610012 [Tetrasphaera jenkinsii Ben 74]
MGAVLGGGHLPDSRPIPLPGALGGLLTARKPPKAPESLPNLGRMASPASPTQPHPASHPAYGEPRLTRLARVPS